MSYRKRKNNKISSRRKTDHNEAKRFIVIGSCIILVLLIAAIVLTVRRSNSDRALSESAALVRASAEELRQAEAESAEAAEAAEAHGLLTFKLCEIQEITDLVRDYFDARLAADSSRIYEIFGRSDTSYDEAFEEKLKAQADWIQAFDDITVYTVPGESDDDYLCIVTYEIDFRRTDTYAPGIMYFFAVRGDDGEYTFAEGILKDKVDYAREVLSGASALSLIEDTDTRLKTALDSDSTLALIYVSFRNGEIYKENELDVDQDQSVGFFDPSDSILVDEDVLAEIRAEAEAAAAKEALEGASDVYIYGEDEDGSGTEESGDYDAGDGSEETEGSDDDLLTDGVSGDTDTDTSGESYAVYSSGQTGPGPGSITGAADTDDGASGESVDTLESSEPDSKDSVYGTGASEESEDGIVWY